MLDLELFSLLRIRNVALSFVVDSFAADMGILALNYALKDVFSYNPDNYIIILIKSLIL
jgi:hypothetical protein